MKKSFMISLLVFNFISLIFLIIVLFEWGFPNPRDDVFYLTILLIVLPIVNSLGLLFFRNDENILSLYLQRKALEQKVKMQELNRILNKK